MTLAELLTQARQELTATSPNASFDAECLVTRALAIPRTRLYSHPEMPVPKSRLTVFWKWLQRRCQGEPLAYIIQEKEFWTLNLKVTPDTLIPRPETELLVEAALDKIPTDRSYRIADLGTGSGAIALALAGERPLARITATDSSAETLEVARFNAQHHHINNVSFCQSHWFESLDNRPFDLIVSNPPYISPEDPHLQNDGIRHEPRQALVSKANGLEDLTTIIAEAVDHLTSPGWLMVEHGYDQKEALHNLLTRHGYQHIGSKRDLAGHDRIIFAQKP